MVIGGIFHFGAQSSITVLSLKVSQRVKGRKGVFKFDF